jgi:hypothetical protein
MYRYNCIRYSCIGSRVPTFSGAGHLLTLPGTFDEKAVTTLDPYWSNFAETTEEREKPERKTRRLSPVLMRNGGMWMQWCTQDFQEAHLQLQGSSIPARLQSRSRDSRILSRGQLAKAPASESGHPVVWPKPNGLPNRGRCLRIDWYGVLDGPGACWVCCVVLRRFVTRPVVRLICIIVCFCSDYASSVNVSF